MDHLQTGTRRQQELRRIGRALHDLCQPLTTLRCRMELAQMVDTPESYREAVDSGLGECMRLAAEVGSMRELLRTAIEEAAIE